MREPETLARVAAALRAFHDGPEIPGTFDSFRVVETLPPDGDRAWWSGSRDVRVGARDRGARSRRSAAAVAPRACHNDLLNANFLDDGERLRIVDWEYAGMGDRFFDLANFSINHELDAAQSETPARGVLRRSCARRTGDALELMRFMSDFREAMWGVVQSAVSELDFDFDAYASRALRATPPDGRRRPRSAPRSPETSEGRLSAPLAATPNQQWLRVGRHREPAGLLGLEPLELLLRAHAHGAL